MMSQCGRATVNKENAKDRPKASCIPKPVNRSRARTPLAPSNTTASVSLVKPVPDFDKLYISFQQKLEKAKSSHRNITKFKTFDLTPSSKSRHQQSEADAGGGEKRGRSGRRVGKTERCKVAVHDRLQAETNDESIDSKPDSQEASLPAQPQTPSLVRRALHQPWEVSPGHQIRLSVYSRRDRALRKMLQSDGPVAAATGTHSVARGNTFSQLLQDMVQSTVASIRTVSRLAEMETGGGELDGVRMRLESQLEEAEEPPATPTPHPSQMCLTLSHLTKPHPLPRHSLNSPPALSDVYQEDPELCAIVWNRKCDRERDRGRPHCPVAKLLEQCYMTSVDPSVSKF